MRHRCVCFDTTIGRCRGTAVHVTQLVQRSAPKLGLGRSPCAVPFGRTKDRETGRGGVSRLGSCANSVHDCLVPTRVDETTHEPTVSPSSRGDSTTMLGVIWVHPRVCFTPLRGESMDIGRSSDCHVHLPSNQVSRRHASFRRLGPVWVVTDRGSRNGTFHGGRRTTESPIAAGDVLRLGDWLGVVQAASPHATPCAEIDPVPVVGTHLRELIGTLRRVAPSALPIVLLGDTGTGKEVLARAVHAWSQRTGPFVAINCAAIPESLAEAALFGNTKGAFTGAEHESTGFFREAHQGTLLLDEIGDLSPRVQAKLLRTLEDGTVTPVGAARSFRVDVRVIAAGHRDLPERVEQGRLRDDLYARLQGLEVEIPPLSARREEIVPLFFHYASRELGGRAVKAQPDLMEQLLLHDWPRNVRELVQVTRQMVVLHGSEPVLRASHLPPRVSARSVDAPAVDVAPASSQGSRAQQAAAHRQRDLRRLVSALRETRGNVSKAADALHMPRSRAYRLLEAERDLDLASLRSSHS